MPRQYLPWGLVSVAVAATAGIAWGLLDRAGPEEQFHAGLAALERGDAESVAEMVISLESSQHVYARVLRAGLLVRRGDYAAALVQLSEVYLPGEGDVWVGRLANQSIDGLGLLEAASLLRALARAQPDSPNVHRWLALIYYDLGAMGLAIEHLQQLMRLVPDDYRPYRLAGLIYHDLDQHERAISAYEAVLRLQPPTSVRQEVLRELARSRMKQRDYAGAIRALEEIPQDAYVLALLAECHRNLGDTELAQDLLAQAQELDPEQREVMLLSARMALDAGDAEAALAPLWTVLEHEPHDYECRYELALAYRALGRLDDYQEQMTQVEHSRDLTQTAAELNRQAAQEPTNAEIRDRLARICEQLGKPELAETWRRAAEACRAMARRSAGPAVAPP